MPAVCPCCGAYGYPLGQLGRLMHYRCRDCGATFHEHTEE